MRSEIVLLLISFERIDYGGRGKEGKKKRKKNIARKKGGRKPSVSDEKGFSPVRKIAITGQARKKGEKEERGEDDTRKGKARQSRIYLEAHVLTIRGSRPAARRGKGKGKGGGGSAEAARARYE